MLHYVTEQLERNSSPDRLPLQKLLKHSNEYNFQAILSKIKNTHLYVETAIVHGKVTSKHYFKIWKFIFPWFQLGEHDKAISILVSKVEGVDAAEDYCSFHAKHMNRTQKANLYATLLKAYLRPPG